MDLEALNPCGLNGIDDESIVAELYNLYLNNNV